MEARNIQPGTSNRRYPQLPLVQLLLWWWGDLTGSFQIPEIWLLIWAEQGSQCPHLVSVEISAFVPARARDTPPPHPNPLLWVSGKL